ncbi:MAG: hypothetical protein ABSA43_00380 [Candidatus Microgenomates bacterium]|jgi:hypothetical protein
MTPDRLIDRLICITINKKTSFRLLSEEVDKFAEAMVKATETGKPQPITVGQEKFVITDPDHNGREVKPA